MLDFEGHRFPFQNLGKATALFPGGENGHSYLIFRAFTVHKVYPWVPQSMSLRLKISATQ